MSTVLDSHSAADGNFPLPRKPKEISHSVLLATEIEIAKAANGDINEKVRRINALPEGLREAMQRRVFGDKLPGDLHLRSTRGHPTTNYGDPSGSGGSFDDFGGK